MKTYFSILSLCLFLTGGVTRGQDSNTESQPSINKKADFTLVFASCSDQNRKQPLWQPILETEPDLFIWGGDNIYADTEDMAKMKADYDKLRSHPEYARLRTSTPIKGTWDDHDYGVNDGGKEYPQKRAAKELFLEFLEAPENDSRRSRPGVYHAEVIRAEEGSIKLILLDTRSFRDGLKDSPDPDRRYDSWPAEHTGTLLGEAQWLWLEEQLQDDTHDFTIIVSSIQLLNSEHGWESWGNFSAEHHRMLGLIQQAKAPNVIVLSGDRHQGEISRMEQENTSALIDFTSSGMTHTYLTSGSEDNTYRISNVVKQLNFGVLQFDFKERQVVFEIRGRDNFVYERHKEQY